MASVVLQKSRILRNFAPVFVLFALWSRAARADFDGQWKQGPLKEQYTVQQWLPGCGPPPVSMSTGGGEAITVRQEGDELSFLGGGRVFKTNQCYDPMPTLSRDAHSRDPSGRSWQTRCTTPPSDPRYALMQSRVTATSDTHIELSETGRYEVTLKEGKCVADIARSRTFDLMSAPAATSTTPPPPQPTQVTQPTQPSTACTTPGDPARLEVRPSKKIMKVGDRFTFQAIVRDANGCTTSTATSWSVVPSTDGKSRLSVDEKGNVTVLADASEGETEITVSAAGKSTKVIVDVSLPGNYDALLAQSGLNASGQSDEAAVVAIATGSLGGQDTNAVGEAQHRKKIFLAIVAAMGALLFVLAFFGWRRTRKATAIEREAEARHQARLREAEERQREKVAEHAAAMRAHEESVERATVAAKEQQEEATRTQAMACPACHREFPSGATFCPSDGSKLIAVAGNEAILSGPAGGICPTCKRGFDAGVKVCPDDGDELVPYAMRPGVSVAPARGKICPTCGDRFDGSASFCGKDGTALVLLN